MSILNQTYFDQHGARRKMIDDSKSKTMAYEELRDKMYALLNEAKDMSADDVMAVVGCVHERTKCHFAMAVHEQARKEFDELWKKDETNE